MLPFGRPVDQLAAGNHEPADDQKLAWVRSAPRTEGTCSKLHSQKMAIKKSTMYEVRHHGPAGRKIHA